MVAVGRLKVVKLCFYRTGHFLFTCYEPLAVGTNQSYAQTDDIVMSIADRTKVRLIIWMILKHHKDLENLHVEAIACVMYSETIYDAIAYGWIVPKLLF